VRALLFGFEYFVLSIRVMDCLWIERVRKFFDRGSDLGFLTYVRESS